MLRKKTALPPSHLLIEAMSRGEDDDNRTIYKF